MYLYLQARYDEASIVVPDDESLEVNFVYRLVKPADYR